MGNISIVISVAPAIGPTISGLILNAFSWRWLFGFVLPIAIAALILGMVKVQNVSTPRKAPIDVVSVVLSAFAFGGIVYGLSSIGEAGATGPLVPVTALVVGAVALAVFIVRQTRLQRTDSALLDLRTFRTRGFTVPIVAMGLSFMAMFGTLILLLPFARVGPGSAGFMEALFTSASAVTVTGLATVDIGDYWTPAGQTVILVLVEIGGLGIVALATVLEGSEAFYVVAGRLGQRTPHGVSYVEAGGTMNGHEANMPMQVFNGGTTDLSALIMFVVDAAKPFSEPAKLD
jgi:DHA2 family lincomycin resistance protein-like MFS transporter